MHKDQIAGAHLALGNINQNDSSPPLQFLLIAITARPAGGKETCFLAT